MWSPGELLQIREKKKLFENKSKAFLSILWRLFTSVKGHIIIISIIICFLYRQLKLSYMFGDMTGVNRGTVLGVQFHIFVLWEETQTKSSTHTHGSNPKPLCCEGIVLRTAPSINPKDKVMMLYNNLNTCTMFLKKSFVFLITNIWSKAFFQSTSCPTMWVCTMASTAVQWLASSPHSKKVLVQILAGAFLWGLHMFSLCLRGLSQSTQTFSHISKTCMGLGYLVKSSLFI